jgi:hypothetical protein
VGVIRLGFEIGVSIGSTSSKPAPFLNYSAFV